MNTHSTQPYIGTVFESLPFRVLLYYKYVPIENPEEFAREHLALCRQLGLLGRILVAAEGMNGTVSGPAAQTASYMAALRDDPRFSDMPVKCDEAAEHAFRKMHVRVKPELVNFRLEQDVNPCEVTGRRLSPSEFHEALNQPDVVVLDARNAYEYEIGHFRGAVRPGVATTREFPQWVRENLEHLKDRKVVTYCTGGIRCEKFSALLLQEGFTDVSQLDGGIVSYGKDPEVQGRLFDGKCYVFDRRGAVEVNRTPEASVVGRCHHCGEPCERMVNCANTDCDNQYLCCIPCELTHRRSCTPECTAAPRHEFDPATAGTIRSFYR